MLILIIFGVLSICGILMFVFQKIDEIYWERLKTDALEIIGILTAVIFGLGLLVCSTVVMIVQIPKENQYQRMLYEKQVLEYRLEQKEENIIGNEMLYSEIVKFNNTLRTVKRYSDSLWVGIFYNDKIATIEYIEICV